MSTEPITPTDPNIPDGGTPEGTPKPQETTFSQADVERIVRERLQQQAKNKFGDYDDLKTKAGESQTLEQRVKDMETRTLAAESAALRASVAAEFGISTKKGPKGEPSDADLFLTGSDVDTLTAQAQRLAGREEDRKKQGNFAPKEGTQPAAGADSGEREFVRNLFSRAE
jgi:hypothetical protein